VPNKDSAARKSPAKKSAATKSAARKSPAKKSAATKSAARKSPAKKSAATKSAARNSPAKKSVAKSATSTHRRRSRAVDDLGVQPLPDSYRRMVEAVSKDVRAASKGISVPNLPNLPESLVRSLRVVSAHAELISRASERLIYAATLAHLPQRQIASNLRVPQTTVHRIAKKVALEPYLSSETPRDVILAYATGEISRPMLLERLTDLAAPAERDPSGGDGYRRGTRDEIERAVGEGLLNEDDWNAIAERAQRYPDLLAVS
jgi:hypothetical protein